MKAVFMTDRGKVRRHNEDNGGIYINSGGQRLAIVADGMGGHRAGDVASEMTLTSLKGFWDQTDYFQTADEAEGWSQKHIAEVNTILYEHSKVNEQCEGMGTTVVLCDLYRPFCDYCKYRRQQMLYFK